jgi:hypothetical protein
LTLEKDRKYRNIVFRKSRGGESMTSGRKPGFKK